MSYILPQVQVFQIYKSTPATVRVRNAFVFGPHYQAVRSAVAGAYDPLVSTPVDYPSKAAGGVIDAAFAQLDLSDVIARYAAIAEQASNPIVCISETERNKLRAAPYILAAEAPDAATGVNYASGGYFRGGQELPDAFYLVPSGGWTGSAWSASGFVSVLNSSQDAVLAYRTIGGLSGVVTIPASAAPLTSGSIIQGPSGVTMDFDVGTRRSALITYAANPSSGDLVTINTTVFEFTSTSPTPGNVGVNIGGDARESYNNLKLAIQAEEITGIEETVHTYGGSVSAGTVRVVGDADFTDCLVDTTPVTIAAYNSLRAPATLKIGDAAGANYFTLKLAATAYGTAIDNLLATSPLTVKVTLDIGAGPASVTWTPSTTTLAIVSVTASTTVAALRALVAGNSDAAEWFDISAVSGTGTTVVAAALDETRSPMSELIPIVMLRDGYRQRVDPNDYIFATANGYNNSLHFKSRGVRVGDSVKWAYTDFTGSYSGMSKIVQLEADQSAESIADPDAGEANAADQTATVLGYKTGAALVAAGVDNQRAFDGAGTRVLALDAVNGVFPGNYTGGLLSDSILVTITAAGAAGTAKATVASVNGSYIRTNVPINRIDNDADIAAVYIGQGLYLVLEKGSGDADALFQAGDTYTVGAVDASFAEITGDLAVVSGKYRGPRDTRYVVEVVRGGVFNRVVTPIDGLSTASKTTATLSANPATTGEFVTVDGVEFRFKASGGPDVPGKVMVVIGTDITATSVNLADAISASAANAFATSAAGVTTITGPTDVVAGVTKTCANLTLAISTAALTVSADFDAWLGGDNDDEYVLRCTQSGSITTAVFALESLRNDAQTGIRFTGSGIAHILPIGALGLQAYFTVTSGAAFSVGNYWVIRALASRPQVKISDTAGVDQGAYTTVNDAEIVDLGLYGAELTFAANSNTSGGVATGGGLRKGDVFYVAATAAADARVKTLVLADDMPAGVVPGLAIADLSDPDPDARFEANAAPTKFALDLYLAQSLTSITAKKLQSPPDFNWVAGADYMTVNAGIAVQDPSWYELDLSRPWLPVYSAGMVITYRAMLQDYVDTIYEMTDIGDIVTTLGEITPDNPLAFGVYNAMLNSGTSVVKYMGVATDDLAGYLSVLDRASLNDTVFGFAPMSVSADVIAAVKAHCVAMSTASEKRWRICFYGSTLPTTKAVYTAATNPSHADWQATLTDDPSMTGTQYTLFSITSADPKALTNVKAGDKVRINFSTDAWGSPTYETYTVASVPSNSTIKLASGPGTPITFPSRFELYHTNSTPEIVTAIKALSTAQYQSLGRMIHCLPCEGMIDTYAADGRYAAAQVAALACGVAPQQGLTNVEVNGFTDIPMLYRMFSKTQLNEIAEAGTLIVMQDMPGGRVYVRHQLTTAAPDNVLETAELSMRKNFDAICYFYADMFAPFIGKYNVTPEMMVTLSAQFRSGLNYLASSTNTSGIGPMIDATRSKLNSIQQDPTFQDHIIMAADIGLPPPFNVLQLFLSV